MQSILRAPRIRKGESIAVLAPASPQRDDARLRSGIACLVDLGYTVVEGEYLWQRYGYLAGRDEERLSDLNGAIRDSSIRMIIAGRGGYGTTRLLDGIDYNALRDDPKLVVGFSDVTALNLALFSKIGLVSLSGAMPGVDLWQPTPDPLALASFLTSTSTTFAGDLSLVDPEMDLETLRTGEAIGRLIPANLTLLASLCGTPYLPDMRGAILLLEEIGEEAYRVDRLLSQLWNSGILSSISGLLIGAFTGSEPRRISVDPLPLEEVFREYVERASVPTISGLSYGHIDRKLTLPVGVNVRVTATDKPRIELLEAGVL